MNAPASMMQKESQRECGIALPIVLIFMVVMMLLGVTVIRNVTLGEKMAGNLRNQQLAFQATEKALRYCENAVQGTVPAGGPTPTKQTPATPDLWDVADNWATGSAVSVAVPRTVGADNNPVDGLVEAPRCMVEDVTDTLALDPTEIKKDESLQVYRITARGKGGTDSAVVMLQSYLKFK